MSLHLVALTSDQVVALLCAARAEHRKIASTTGHAADMADLDGAMDALRQPVGRTSAQQEIV